MIEFYKYKNTTEKKFGISFEHRYWYLYDIWIVFFKRVVCIEFCRSDWNKKLQGTLFKLHQKMQEKHEMQFVHAVLCRKRTGFINQL